MQESFLHFIWRYQYFDKSHLRTTCGKRLTVLDPGVLNTNAGPDFSQARIKLDELEWMGMIEIHVKSSQWFQHNHQKDPAYDQVMLHVVWKDNQPVSRKNGTDIPTLELLGRIASGSLLRHRKLIQGEHKIGCHSQFNRAHHHQLEAMMDHSLKARLLGKQRAALQQIKSTNYDWDQGVYRILGRNFGFKINAEPFESLIKAVPLWIAKKLSSRVSLLEALYFGQGGFLKGPCNDRYFWRLQKDYDYLLKMFPKMPSAVKTHQWKYLRLRPSNFPATRVAQFVQLIHLHRYRFSHYRSLQDWSDLTSLFDVQVSKYWQSHYQFSKESSKRVYKIGQASIHNIAINTVIPVLLAYHKYHEQDEHHGQVVSWLKSLPAEENSLTRYWKANGYKVSSAYQSQALLALNENYCEMKLCLSCDIGLALMKGRAK